MFNKQIIAVVGPLLVLTSFNSLAEPGNPSIRERIVDQVLKPCEGKKAGDKVLIVDHRGGKRISFRTLRAIARKNVINLSQLRR